MSRAPAAFYKDKQAVRCSLGKPVQRRGASSIFQRKGSKKNSILHSGVDPENFGGGDEILH